MSEALPGAAYQICVISSLAVYPARRATHQCSSPHDAPSVASSAMTPAAAPVIATSPRWITESRVRSVVSTNRAVVNTAAARTI